MHLAIKHSSLIHMILPRYLAVEIFPAIYACVDNIRHVRLVRGDDTKYAVAPFWRNQFVWHLI